MHIHKNWIFCLSYLDWKIKPEEIRSWKIFPTDFFFLPPARKFQSHCGGFKQFNASAGYLPPVWKINRFCRMSRFLRSRNSNRRRHPRELATISSAPTRLITTPAMCRLLVITVNFPRRRIRGGYFHPVSTVTCVIVLRSAVSPSHLLRNNLARLSRGKLFFFAAWTRKFRPPSATSSASLESHRPEIGRSGDWKSPYGRANVASFTPTVTIETGPAPAAENGPIKC